MILALGEEVGPALCQPYKCPAIVNFQPAQADRAIEAGPVFRRRSFVAEQKWAVEFLDIDAAILHRLEGVCVLHEAARGFIWIGIWSVGCELHRADTFSPRSIAAYFRAVQSR
jgi:hypothetical protein